MNLIDKLVFGTWFVTVWFVMLVIPIMAHAPLLLIITFALVALLSSLALIGIIRGS